MADKHSEPDKQEPTAEQLAEAERLRKKLIAEGKVKPYDSEGGSHRQR